MIGIGIRIGVAKTSNPVSVVVATSATGVGETSFTANWNPYSGAQYYLLDVSTSSSFSSFVLQNQVVSTNSYIVTGLTASTTYYYRVRASTDPDPDAQAYINRVYTAGGTLTNTEANAVNQLTIDMKAAGIWTSMKAVYPMIGSSAASCAQNLKSSSFTGSFSVGGTYSSNGYNGNGVAYMDTQLTPSVSLLNANHHISYYSRTNPTPINCVEMGVNDNSGYYSPQFRIRLDGFYGYTNTFMYTSGSSSDYAWALSTNTDAKGFFIGTITSTTSRKTYKNGIISGTNTNNITNSLGTGPIYINAVNNQPNTAAFFSDKQCAFASIGDGLTDTQASNFYTAVQAFQTTLSRQV